MRAVPRGMSFIRYVDHMTGDGVMTFELEANPMVGPL